MTEALLDALSLKVGSSCYDNRGSSTDSDSDDEDRMCLSVESGSDDPGGHSDLDEDKMCLTVESSSNNGSQKTDCVASEQSASKKKGKKSVSFDLDKNSETVYFPSEALSPKKSPEKSEGFKLGNPQVRLTPIDPSIFSSLKCASADSVRYRQGDSKKLSPTSEEKARKAKEVVSTRVVRSTVSQKQVLELDSLAEKLVSKTGVVKATATPLAARNGLKGSASSDLKTKSKLAVKSSPADKTAGNASRIRQINVVLKTAKQGTDVAGKGEVLKNRTELKSPSETFKSEEQDDESDHDNLCIDLKPHEVKIAESLSGTFKSSPSKSDVELSNSSANEGPSASTKPVSSRVSSPVKPAKPIKINETVKNESGKKTNNKEKSVSKPEPQSSTNENKLTLYGEADKTVSVMTVRLLCMKCVQAARKDTPSKSTAVNQIVVKVEDCEVCKRNVKSELKSTQEEKVDSGGASNLEKVIESVARNFGGNKPEIKESKSNDQTSNEALIQEALKNVVNTENVKGPSLDGNVIIVKSSTGLTSTKSVLSKSNSIIIKDNAMKTAIRNASKNLKPSGMTTLDGKLYKVIFLPKSSALTNSSTIICSRTVKNPAPKAEKTEMVVSSVADSTHAPLSAAEVSSLNSLGSPCILTADQLSSAVASTPNLQKVTPTPQTVPSPSSASAVNGAIISPAKLVAPATTLSNVSASCPSKTIAVTSSSPPVHTCGPLKATLTTLSQPSRTTAVIALPSIALVTQPSKTTPTTSSISNVPVSHPAKTVSSTSLSKTNPATSSLPKVLAPYPPKSGPLTTISITSSLTPFNVLASNTSKSSPSNVSASHPAKVSSSPNVSTCHPSPKTASTASSLSSVPITHPPETTATPSVPSIHPPKTTPVTSSSSNGTVSSSSKNNQSSPQPVPKILADKFKGKNSNRPYFKTFFGQRVYTDVPEASSAASPDNSSSFIALQDYLAQSGGKSISNANSAAANSPPMKFGEIKIPVNFDSSKIPCAALMRNSSVISLKSGPDRSGVAVSAEGVKPLAVKRARMSPRELEKSSSQVDVLDADAKKSIIDAVIMPPFTPAVSDSVYDSFTSGAKFKCPQCPNTFSATEHLQNHLNRRSALLKYDCPACRNLIIFYNRCMLKQHCEKQHAAEVDLNCLTIDVLPLSLFDVSHFGCAKTGDLTKKTIEVAKKTLDAANSASAVNVTSTVKNVVSKAVKKPSKSKPSAKTSDIANLNLPEETDAPNRLLDLAQDWNAATSGIVQDFNDDFNIPPAPAKSAKKRNSRGKSVEVSPDILVQCGECQAEVPSLRAHLQDSGKPNPKFTCPCKKVCTSACSLKAHSRWHNKKPPHSCPECGEVLNSASLLDEHFKQTCYHSFKRNSFACRRCRQNFSSQSKLEGHILKNHTHQVIICGLCSFSNSDSVVISSHMKVKHAESAGLPEFRILRFMTCDFCPKAKFPRHQCQQHIQQHITRNYFYHCSFCSDFKTVSKVDFGQHLDYCLFSSSLRSLENEPDEMDLSFSETEDDPPPKSSASYFKDKFESPSNGDGAKGCFKHKYKSSNISDKATPAANLTKKPLFSVEGVTPTSDPKSNFLAKAKPTPTLTVDEATPAPEPKGNSETKLKSAASFDKTTPISNLKSNFEAKSQPTHNVPSTTSVCSSKVEIKSIPTLNVDKATPAVNPKSGFENKSKPAPIVAKVTPAFRSKDNFESKSKPPSSCGSSDSATSAFDLQDDFEAESISSLGDGATSPNTEKCEIKSKEIRGCDKVALVSDSKGSFEVRAKLSNGINAASAPNVGGSGGFQLKVSLSSDKAVQGITSGKTYKILSNSPLSAEKTAQALDAIRNYEAKLKLSRKPKKPAQNLEPKIVKTDSKLSLKEHVDSSTVDLGAEGKIKSKTPHSEEEAALDPDLTPNFETESKLTDSDDDVVTTLDPKLGFLTKSKVSFSASEASSAKDDCKTEKSSPKIEQELSAFGTSSDSEMIEEVSLSDDEAAQTFDQKRDIKTDTKLPLNGDKAPTVDSENVKLKSKSSPKTNEATPVLDTTHKLATKSKLPRSDIKSAPTSDSKLDSETKQNLETKSKSRSGNKSAATSDSKLDSETKQNRKTKSKLSHSDNKSAATSNSKLDSETKHNLEIKSKLSRSDTKSAATSDSKLDSETKLNLEIKSKLSCSDNKSTAFSDPKLDSDTKHNLETKSKLSRSDKKSAATSDSRLDAKTNAKVSPGYDKAKSTLDLKSERETKLKSTGKEEQAVSIGDTTRNIEAKSESLRSDDKAEATVEPKLDSKNSKQSLGSDKAKLISDLKGNLKTKLATSRNEDEAILTPDKTPSFETKSKLSSSDEKVRAHDSKHDFKMNRKWSLNGDGKASVKSNDSFKPMAEPKKTDNNLGALKETRKLSGESVNLSGRDSSAPGSFKQAISLADHMQNTQPSVFNANLYKLFSQSAKIMQCKYCPEQFESTVSAFTHLKSEHGNLIAHTQSLKRKSAQPPAHVKSKIMKNVDSNQKSTENDSSSHNCSKCNFIGQSYNDLFNHMETHKTIYECPKCKDSFVARPSLEKHLIVSHRFDAKEARSFVDRSSACSEVVKENGAYHARQGFYQCATCYKNFTSEESFNTHFRTHGLAFVNDGSPAKLIK